VTRISDIAVPPELIERARAGERAAQAELYEAYARPVFAIVCRLVERRALAEDVLQETFVEVLRSLPSYRGTGALGAWIRQVAVRKCLMALRSPWHRRLRWLAELREPAPAAVADRCEAPRAEVALDLERALAQLSPLSRAVVWLHDVEGCTHAEIARVTGKTESFSKSQLARSHARLREWITAEHGELPCMSGSTICCD
jgi:RNA polymerase sigma factor (sigma-70 family)